MTSYTLLFNIFIAVLGLVLYSFLQLSPHWLLKPLADRKWKDHNTEHVVFQTKLIVVRVSPDVAPTLHGDKIDTIHSCQEALVYRLTNRIVKG